MAADTRVSITVDTGNAEDAIRRLREELDRLGGSADDASDDIDNAGNSGKKLSKALDGMKTIGAATGVALGAIGFALKGSVDAAMKFESAMADVKKVVNFDSPQGLQNMRQDLLDLSTQIPITADGLAQIAAAAGQSGIAANEITKFTEAAAKMGTAFDISAQEAGQAMAEMRTAFKMSQTDVEALADKINYLGNTSPNSAAKIMKIVQTVGPLGELAGVSAAQIAAMGASVNSLAPEVVATGLKNMFLALTKGESATKSASDAFKKLGLDSVQVSKDMQQNSEATINRIIESLKKLPEAQRTATINDIFGAEALPVIAQMVTNTETLTKNLTAVGDATKYAGSMQQEYAARSATTENQLALFSNNLNVLKVNVGSALLPAINQLAQAVIPVVQSMATWAQQNPDLVTQIVAITGSTEVGRILMSQCASTVKKLSMELGGNAPFIVFDDADLEKAASGLIASKYRNAGQTCVCANRVYVQASIKDKFLAIFKQKVEALKVGNGMTEGVNIGPLINQGALDKVEQLLEDAVNKGATVVTGGKKHSASDLSFEPTIITGITDDMDIATQEIFGPIAPVFVFDSDDEVIAHANNTIYGLAAYFYTQSLARSWKVCEGLEYGMVAQNTGLLSTEVAPFGGVKQSGFGREGSKYGIEDYVTTKYWCIDVQ